MLAQGMAIIEQHGIAPPLRLVHGQRMAEVEGVVAAQHGPGDLLLRPFRAGFRA